MKAVCSLVLFGLALCAASGHAENHAPGRIIMKVDPMAASEWMVHGSTGYPALDAGLDELDIAHARRLARPRSDGANRDLRQRLGVEGVMAIRYRSGDDPVDVAARLSALPEVIYAHPDYYGELHEVPNDPYYEYQYAMPLMHMPAAWDLEKGSEDIVVGVSDTGTDWNHPDLIDNIYINDAEDLNGNGVFDNYAAAQGGDLDDVDADGNGYVDDVIGWDFVTGEYPEEGEDGYPPDPDPMDFGGHGTNTAGIVAAVTDNGLMVAGTTWYSKVMPLKVMYDATQGSGAITSDMVESFYYAADNGADVLSMSWGIPDSEALHDACIYAHAAGVLLVASAGNDNNEEYHLPSSYPEVLSVAATQMGDLKADFSSFGTWVAICAPGVDIWTLAFNDSTIENFSGTSASCPYVAGVASLVMSMHPELTNDEVYHRLAGTADQIDLINPDYWGKLGAGRANAYRALTEEPHPTLRLAEFVVDDNTGGNGDSLLGPGETAVIKFKVRNFWQTATNVVGYLTTSDPNMTVDSTFVITFGTIETDSTVLSPDGATVEVAVDAEIGYQARFVLTLYSDENYVIDQPFGIPVAEQLFADAAGEYDLETSGRTHTVAFADFDSDGDVDIYRANWSFNHSLYRNDGTTLVDVTGEWGLPMTGKGQGTSWGDYDNDGDPDLLHGTMEGIALFRNDGPGSGFADVTDQANLSGDAVKNFTPVWGDYDGDGWLDIYVAHQEQDNLLFHSNGDGTFTDVGETAGVNSSRASYAACFVDFDRDGDQDLFVANCGPGYEGEPNELFVNQGDGTFVNQAPAMGLADEPLVSTSGVWGDYDNDGWPDLYVSNIGPSFNGGEPNKLYRNIRGRGFLWIDNAGVEDLRSSAAASWGDFDGDGWLDLFVCNSQRNALFRNLGNGTFGDATASFGIFDWGWVAAWVDLDEDGDEDIYVGRGGADKLMMNLSPPAPYIKVLLEGAGGTWGSSHDANRATVRLSGEGGTLQRILGEGCGLGQSPLRAILPLPPVGSDPAVTIAWPSGTLQQEMVPGEGIVLVMESRPTTDLALRSLVLPLDTGPSDATVSGVVLVCDNGQNGAGPAWIKMTVTTESGAPVFTDSVQYQEGDTAAVVFPRVPVPSLGERLHVSYAAMASNDDAGWNDILEQLVTGGELVEGFEAPPVYWSLSEGWRRVTTAGGYPANSGSGALLLSSGEAGVFLASTPQYYYESGSEVNLRFHTMHSIGEDTVWVRAVVEDTVLAQMPLTGVATDYLERVLTLNIGSCIGNLFFTWSCTRTEATGEDWFLLLDDVEPILLTSSDENLPKPLTLRVSPPWPNPSARTMNWRILLPEEGELSMEIHDIAGRQVLEQELGEFSAGSNAIQVSPRGLASGLYLATFRTSTESCSRLFVRLRK